MFVTNEKLHVYYINTTTRHDDHIGLSCIVFGERSLVHKRHIQFKPNFKSSTKNLIASAAEKQPCVDISQDRIGSKYIYYPASKKKFTRTILWCDTELAGTSTVTIGCIHGIAGVVDEDSQDTEFCPVFARAKQKNKHMFVKARGMSEDLPLLVIYLLQR